MGFPLVLKLVTLNHLERRNGCYVVLFPSTEIDIFEATYVR